MACQDDLDEFTRSIKETGLDTYKIRDYDCWKERIGTNPDEITVLAGSNYTFDGTYSFDDTPTGVMEYEWESLDGSYFLPDTTPNSTHSTPQVIVPGSIDQSYIYTLRVSDGQYWSKKDTITIVTAKPSTLSAPNEFYSKVKEDINHIQLVWTSESERELDSLTGYRDF
ncbi:uncharacterized protein METZ01_LOCUS458688, partial [marine metagenome]